MKLRVKNWAKHQHYKNRTPPWIKLHRSILEDPAYIRLPVASRALAPLLWLLASQSEGEVDGDPSLLAFQLRLDEDEVREGLKSLIDQGFMVPVNAPCERDASAPLASPSVSVSVSVSEEGSAEGRSGIAVTDRPKLRDPDGDPVDESAEPGVRAAPRRAVIPDQLLEAIPDFPERWRERLNSANRKPKVSAEEKQLEELVDWLQEFGVEGVLASVAAATRGGYQGIFPPNRPLNGKRARFGSHAGEDYDVEAYEAAHEAPSLEGLEF